jgi:hypothetical protein
VWAVVCCQFVKKGLPPARTPPPPAQRQWLINCEFSVSSKRACTVYSWDFDIWTGKICRYMDVLSIFLYWRILTYRPWHLIFRHRLQGVWTIRQKISKRLAISCRRFEAQTCLPLTHTACNALLPPVVHRIQVSFCNMQSSLWHAWERRVCKVLVGKPHGKRPLGKPRRRWEDGIRMDLREISWGSVVWIQLAQVRDRWRAIVNTVMNLWVLAPRS